MPDNKRGRPSTPPIDVNETPVANILKEIFEEHIFQNNSDYVRLGTSEALGRATYIAELVKRYVNNVKLNPVTLKKNLFEPVLYKKSKIKLTEGYLYHLVAFLRAAAHDFKYESHLHLIDAFESRYLGNRLPQQESGDKAHLVTWLLDSGTWRIYERIGEDDTIDTGSRFGVAVGEVIFTMDYNRLVPTVTFSLSDRKREYNGEASFDNYSRYLYFIMSSDPTEPKAFVTLKLAEVDKTHQSLMLGHFTYHSVVYHHLLTKAIVVERQTGTTAPISKGDHYFGEKTYQLIDERITRFLYPREKNRLSFPDITISNINELGTFLKQQEDKTTQNELSHFEGTYSVYYRRKGGEILQDILDIKMNHGKRYYEGTFSHTPDVQRQRTKKYIGQAFENNKVIVIKLNQYINEYKKDEDPILLSFHIPDETFNFNDCECLPGLLSGLQDSDRYPVSYLCLLVRQKDDLVFEGLNDPRILKYFNEEPYYLTTRRTGFRLDDI